MLHCVLYIPYCSPRIGYGHYYVFWWHCAVIVHTPVAHDDSMNYSIDFVCARAPTGVIIPATGAQHSGRPYQGRIPIWQSWGQQPQPST